MMGGMRVDKAVRFFIDADSFPRQGRELLVRIAIKRGIKCIFVANRKLPIQVSSLIQMVEVCQGKDIADQYILAQVQGQDIVFTRDILLAEKLAHRSIFVMNHFGECFTTENIAERRSLRDFSLMAHEQGLVKTPKSSHYGQRELAQLANSIDSQLSHVIKQCDQ
ncbi:MAG: DUF188 domain-containing protein [Spirochaetia bacterium]